MATLPSRAGTIALVLGGLGLLGWMAYALTYGGGPAGGAGDRSEGEVEVAVFLPEPSDWDDLRAGVAACERRGLLEGVEERHGSIVFRTSDHGRPVRLSWFRGGGVVGTRDRVAELVGREGPPVAFLGSNNTVLTAALAESLAAAVEEAGGGPVLLVPWATSVTVERPGEEASPLLGLYRGRTFRFCPNNRQEAELVVRVAGDRAGRPGRAVVVVDENDPYSRDLADGFERAVAGLDPEAELVRRRLDLSSPGLEAGGDRPGPAELAEADALWQLVAESAGDGPVWAVLPLQGGPTRRLIAALIDRASSVAPAVRDRLHVLCGDGIGRDTLDGLAGRCLLPVWCASSGSIPADRRSAGQGGNDLGAAQVPAEIVSALARLLDHPADAAETLDLAGGLRTLEWPPDHPGAFGRSLAFGPDGERRGADLGHVLAIRPGADRVLAYGPAGGAAAMFGPPGDEVATALARR